MGAIIEFWRWWTGELGSLFSGGKSADPGRRRQAIVVDVAADEVRLGRVDGGVDAELEELIRVPRAALSKEEAEVVGLERQLRQHFQADSMVFEVWLPKGSTLVREVELPLAAEENLRGVLGFEMERLTPFRAEDVYYEGKVLSRDQESRKLKVRLTVAPGRLIKEVLGWFRGASLELDRERVEFRAAADRAAVAFLPPPGRRASPWVVGLLAAVNVGLLAAVIAIPMREQGEILEDMRAQLTTARTSAAEANRVQGQIDALAEELRFARRERAASRAAVEIIEEIARRLPDTTWLARLELRRGTVKMSGSSVAASALIEVLQGSEVLTDARFVSPVTQESADRERFHISTRVLSRPAEDDGASAAESKATARSGTS